MTMGRSREERTGGTSRRRRVTIADVAAEAGVSTAAVSKVLRDAYGVSDQMRTKVQAAVDALGYRPHTGARAMRGRSYTVGVMLLDVAAQFQWEIIDGISTHLESTPFQEVLITGGTDPARQKRAVEALLDRQMDGLVLITPNMEASWLEELGRRVPLVTVARHGPSQTYDSVVTDDRLGAVLVVDHLVALGHRRIMHITAPIGELERPSVLSQTPRLDGYLAAMERHGLPPQVIETDYSEPGGHRAAAQALDAATPPSAIFAGADGSALGALRAAEERGLEVPEHLSVVGFDNAFVSGIGRVSLSTVDQDGPATGRIAAELLLQRLDGRTEPAHRVISPDLVIRGTSAPPR
ncbi:LacI family transcriptional regulator [Nesterenkonia sp. PF2B19]|nr:LacI family transcriptional regulator [Nesterenkonia sp. PF2B19]